MVTERRLNSLVAWFHFLSIPWLATFTLDKRYLHPTYRMGWWRRFHLVFRLWKNTRRIRTGISYKAHVAMAAALLRLPPDEPGVVVECGSWLGGTSTNLSIICDITGRKLVVYDSFEGLPEPVPGDAHARPEARGLFAGDEQTVRANIDRHGKLDCCELRSGWFHQSLPLHEEPIVLMFLDVDFQSSLHDCVVNLWPHLTAQGYVFVDEFVFLDYCALFWSEPFWMQNFGTAPPGLMGSGTGIGLGQYYFGPFDWKVDPTSVAYTRKDFCGRWTFEP